MQESEDKLAKVMNAGSTVVNAGANNTNKRRYGTEAEAASRPVSDRVDIAGGVAANGPGAFAKSGKKRREAKAKAEAEAKAAAVVEAAAVPKPWWRFGF